MTSVAPLSLVIARSARGVSVSVSVAESLLGSGSTMPAGTATVAVLTMKADWVPPPFAIWFVLLTTVHCWPCVMPPGQSWSPKTPMTYVCIDGGPFTPVAAMLAAPATLLLQPFGSPSVANTTTTLCVGCRCAHETA